MRVNTEKKFKILFWKKFTNISVDWSMSDQSNFNIFGSFLLNTTSFYFFLYSRYCKTNHDYSVLGRTIATIYNIRFSLSRASFPDCHMQSSLFYCDVLISSVCGVIISLQRAKVITLSLAVMPNDFDWKMFSNTRR